MTYPLLEHVLGIAKRSECTRRKYGAVLHSASWEEKTGIGIYAEGWNKRVTKCCNGGVCARDRLNIVHGTNTDAGAEIHAEQALLLNARGTYGGNMYLAGYDAHGNVLHGFDAVPCYVCARMIKFAGINHVWLPSEDENTNWEPWSISGIMEKWEETWESDV